MRHEMLKRAALATVICFGLSQTSGFAAAQAPGAGANPGGAKAGNPDPSQGKNPSQTPGATTGAPSTTGSGTASGQNAARMSYYGGFSQSPWFGSADVRKQLNLTDEQFNQLNSSYGKGWTSFESSLQGSGNADAQARDEQMRKSSQTFHSDFMKSAQGTLKPEQMQRYNQLYLQYRGYDAFMDPAIQTKLNLTDEQKKTFQTQSAEFNRTMNNLYSTSPENRDAVSKQFNDLRQQSRDRINTTLTPEQRRIWQEMTGDPYTFQWSANVSTGTGAAATTNGGASTINPGSRQPNSPSNNQSTTLPQE